MLRAAARCFRSRGAPVLLLVLWLGVYAGMTALRLPAWRDSERVFLQAVRDNPRSTKSTVALAMHYYYREKKIDEAEVWFRKTLELDPANVYAARHLIDLALKRYRPLEAEHYCREVLKYQPEDGQIREKLEALIRMRKGRQE